MDEKNRKKFYLSIKLNWLYALILSSLCMYMMLSYSGVLTTGKYCLLDGDSFEIYVPTVRNFCRSILNGESVFYSWNNSLGMNTSLSNAFYGGYNPLNILFILFYKVDPNVLVAIMIVIKAGLSGLFFQLLERYILKYNEYSSIIFAVFYSMCSFQVSYGVINFIWMDALYILPILFISIYYLSQKGNPVPLCVSYAYIFIVHFYMGYILGIISFLFFFLSIFLIKRNIKLKKYISGYIFAVIVAILISSFVWMPAAYFLLNNSANDSTAFASFRMTIFEAYNQFFFGNNNMVDRDIPNIYSGVFPLLLLPLFFLDKEISLKDKLLYGIIFFVVFISFAIMPLYIFWHAFDAPDGWNYRFAFCASFILMIIAAFEMKHLIKRKDFRLIIIGAVNILFYIAELFILKFKYSVDDINNPLFLVINCAIIMIWVFLTYYFTKKEKFNNQLVILLILLTCFESIGNGFCTFYKSADKNGVPFFTENMYYPWAQNQKDLVDFTAQDNSFYRINYMGDLCINSDTFSGYNGLSDFCTTENVAVRNALRHLGFATSPRVTRNFGITEPTKMILGVKYDIYGVAGNMITSEDPNIIVYNNDKFLSLGYMVEDDILDYKFPSENAFENINTLLSSMTGDNIKVFNEIDKNNIEIIDKGISMQSTSEGISFDTDENAEKPQVVLSIKSDNQSDFIYFINYFSHLTTDSMMMEYGTENITEMAGNLSWSYIKEFTKLNQGDSSKVVVMDANGIKHQSVLDYVVASYNSEDLMKVYDLLSHNQFEIEKMSNGYVKGNIYVPDNNKMLFTTIPFDKGWSLYIDNKKADYYPILDDAFIGIKFDSIGKHDIVLKYEPIWLKEGIIATIVGLIILIVFITLHTLIRRKKNVNQILKNCNE